MKLNNKNTEDLAKMAMVYDDISPENFEQIIGDDNKLNQALKRIMVYVIRDGAHPFKKGGRKLIKNVEWNCIGDRYKSIKEIESEFWND